METIYILSILSLALLPIAGALDRASADTKVMIEDAREMNKALDQLIAAKKKTSF
jgi:hypothetical protein